MKPIIRLEALGFPWQPQDPFLFCAHHRDEYPAGNGQMGVHAQDKLGRNIGSDFIIKDGWRMYHGSDIPGFPYHPHRGFETITINREGVVDHSDSLGAAGRFMGGDVQWMTAGSGVQHSEMFPMLHAEKANTLEIFQIWLNLPAASKMVEPHFKMLWAEDIPKIAHKDAQGRLSHIDIIAGGIDDTRALSPTPDSWAANPDNAVGVYIVELDAEAEWTLPATALSCTRSIFYHEGDSLRLGEDIVRAQHHIIARPELDIPIKNGSSPSRLLILEGRPIGEPVVQHGPFVMNSEEEIRQTMKDYGRTQFGGWPWPMREMVHPADKGRFALHADGREEQP